MKMMRILKCPVTMEMKMMKVVIIQTIAVTLLVLLLVLQLINQKDLSLSSQRMIMASHLHHQIRTKIELKGVTMPIKLII